MFVIYGEYRFAKRKAGYKSVWCESCNQHAYAERHRHFKFGHLFWLPLIPLGFHSEWFCLECGKDPKGPARSGNFSIGFFAVLAFAVSAAMFAFPAGKGDEVYFVWGARNQNRLTIVNTLAACFCLLTALVLIAGFFLPFIKIQEALLKN